MGYCVDVYISDLLIPKEKMEDCLAAINELFTEENLMKNASGGSYPIKPGQSVYETSWYSWVQNPPEVAWEEHFSDKHIRGKEPTKNRRFNTLHDAVGAWRYHGRFVDDDRGVGYLIEAFVGVKWGDDEHFINAIAPYVATGGSIEVTGEDGVMWRYLFSEGCVVEQTGAVHWQ